MINFFKYIGEHKHRLATFALIFGFFVDLITFRTINLELSQLILSIHLCIVAVSILITSRPKKEGTPKFILNIRSIVPIIHQYSIGNLLSAFLILYSASGSIMASWPFLLLVAFAAIGNETLKLQKFRLPFQTSLFFLSLTLFFALAVPISFNSISAITFILSMFIAGVFFVIFVWFGRVFSSYAFKKNKTSIRFSWGVIFALILFLYFTNIIPPIPLSVKDAGFYHDVVVNGENYVVYDEKRVWLEHFFDLFGTSINIIPGERVYAYTAVFAPANLSANIVHRWQYYDPNNKEWETKNTIRLSIVGGRRAGYRVFSFTDNPTPGRWRVSVETVRGQVIGRKYARINIVDSKQSLEAINK